MNEKNKTIFPSYIVVDSSLFLDQRFSSTDKVLYGLIVALSNNDKHKCFATNNYFANALNLKKRQVQNCLNKLRNYCYISIMFENNKRIITTFINKQIEKRDNLNGSKRNQVEIFTYDWINEED